MLLFVTVIHRCSRFYIDDGHREETGGEGKMSHSGGTAGPSHVYFSDTDREQFLRFLHFFRYAKRHLVYVCVFVGVFECFLFVCFVLFVCLFSF